MAERRNAQWWRTHLVRVIGAAVGLCLVFPTLFAVQMHFRTQERRLFFDLIRGGPKSIQTFLVSLPFYVIVAILLPFILRFASRYGGDRRTWPLNLAMHSVAASLFSFVSVFSYAAVCFVIFARSQALSFAALVVDFLVAYFAHAFLLYWCIVGIFHACFYYDLHQSDKLNLLRLEAQLVEARLQTLRAHLHPHFLFNTLNAISALARTHDHEAVEDALGELGELLRQSFDDMQSQLVPLKKELEFIQNYLKIQHLRFRDRLSVCTHVAPDTLDALVPAMILQPLVENAVVHGIAAHLGPGRIDLIATRDSDLLRLEVRNTGKKCRSDSNRSIGGGVGLLNTRSRLEQLYGSSHRFDLEDLAAGGVVATVIIPFRPAPPAEVV